MKTLITTVVLFAAALVAAGQQETITTTVRVEVRTPEGTPLADVPIQLSSPFGFPLKFSDTQGIAEFQVLRVPRTDPILYGLSTGLIAPISAEDAVHAQTRFGQLRSSYAFPPNQSVMMGAAQTTVTVQVIAGPAVKVHGVIRDTTGTPVRAAVAIADTHSLIDNAPDGAFECEGVPKGKAGKLVMAGTGSQAWVRSLTAAQLTTDLDLGNIVVSQSVANAQARLKWPNPTPMFSSKHEVVFDGVTLVHSAGEIIHVFEIDSQGGMVGLAGTPIYPDQTVALAPGMYYIAPGMIGSAASLKLVDLIRAGRQAELDAAQVPKFTAVEGQTVEYTFDMPAALAAIEGIPEQPPASPPPGP